MVQNKGFMKIVCEDTVLSVTWVDWASIISAFSIGLEESMSIKNYRLVYMKNLYEACFSPQIVLN